MYFVDGAAEGPVYAEEGSGSGRGLEAKAPGIAAQEWD
jgi:hypothetical protein